MQNTKKPKQNINLKNSSFMKNLAGHDIPVQNITLKFFFMKNLAGPDIPVQNTTLKNSSFMKNLVGHDKKNAKYHPQKFLFYEEPCWT